MANYTEVERTISDYVINKIDDMLSEYFGNETKTSELIEKDIALYEKKTFVNLINLHIYRNILSREGELKEWGRPRLTDQEFKNIYVRVSQNSKRWLNEYEKWHNDNPSWPVSDITSKKSKTVKYINMSEANWAKLRSTIETETNKIKNKYSSSLVYDYLNDEEKEKINEYFPDKTLVSKELIKTELSNDVLNSINGEFTFDVPFFNAYIDRMTDTLEQESSELIKTGGLNNSQNKTIQAKHQNYVDYITQQLFADSSYLYGIDESNINSQNVYRAIEKNEQPSLTDFGNFVMSKAVSEAYRGGNSSYGNEDNYKYTEYDIDKVIAENKTYAKEVVIPNYELLLADNNLSSNITGDIETGSAFGIEIPTEEEIKEVYDKVKTEIKSSGILDTNREMTTKDEEDIANYVKTLTNKEDISDEFTEPLVEANTNIVTNELRKRQIVNISSNTPKKSSNNSTLEMWRTNSSRRVDRKAHDEGVASLFAPTYRTFSGHDMVVTVELPLSSNFRITKIIGAFQTVTYSIHNGKSPIRVLGDMNVRRYVQGPRTIAGTLILTVFDRHWMKELLGSYKKIKSETERYFLADELPAFNMTISCTNEYGHDAKLAIYGITIVDEGQVMSINDVYTENTYTFFATAVEYLDRVEEATSYKKKSPSSNLPTKGDRPEPTGESESGESNPTSSSGEPEKKDSFSSKYIYDKNGALDKLKSIDKNGKDSFNKDIDELVDKYNNGKVTDEKFTNKLAEIIKEESKREQKLWEKEITNNALKEIKNSSETEEVKKWQQNKVKENNIQINGIIEDNNTKLANDRVKEKIKQKEDKV